MLAFGFGAIDPVDATTLPVDVFVSVDPLLPVMILPDQEAILDML